MLSVTLTRYPVSTLPPAPAVTALERSAQNMDIPAYWKIFRDENNLVGVEIEIPESEDRSELGAEIVILDDAGILSEATDLYPGIEATRHGFIPIGGCSIGSGDPYFIRTSEGAGGALYRIYHDKVFEDEFPEAQAVTKVLERFDDILRFRINQAEQVGAQNP